MGIHYREVSEIEIPDAVYRIWKLYAGISGLLMVFVIPFLTGVVYMELYNIVHGTGGEFGYYSVWRDGIAEFPTIFSISLFVAIASVYFLRFLFWVRHLTQTTWREHTPPFDPPDQDYDHSTEAKLDEVIPRAELKAWHWAKRGLAFFLGVIGALLIVSMGAEYLGISEAIESSLGGNLLSKDQMEYLVGVINMLPIVGDLSIFLDRLPGEGPLEKILINGTALIFTVSIRNLGYLFENQSYLYDEAEWWTPNRYAIYLVITGIGQALLLSIGILVVINW